MFALAMGIITANAQENVTGETTNGSEQPTLTKEVSPQKNGGRHQSFVIENEDLVRAGTINELQVR